MPKIAGPSRGEGIQAVVLALDVIDCIARQGGSIGVTALSVALGTSKSRIYRHLRTLVEQGYLVQALDSEKYRIGSRLMTLGRLVSQNTDILGAAMGPMRDLRDSLGLSVVVSQFENDGVCVLETLRSNAVIEIGVKRGSILEFHNSSQGRVALAFAPEALRERVRRAPAINGSGLDAALDLIRKQGWGVSPNQPAIGINTLAAPFFDAGGLLAGTLAVVGSVQFIEPQPTSDQIRLVVAAAERITQALGGERPAARHAHRTRPGG
jgi:DNA-binding IclR family transcriptional regulator